MLRRFIMTAVISGLLAGSAMAQDIIVGDWKTHNGNTAEISGSGSYSIKLKTSKFAGKTIGTFSGADGKYAGTITDPEDNKKYSGTARVSGTTMRLKGCALKIFCKTHTWTKM